MNALDVRAVIATTKPELAEVPISEYRETTARWVIKFTNGVKLHGRIAPMRRRIEKGVAP